MIFELIKSAHARYSQKNRISVAKRYRTGLGSFIEKVRTACRQLLMLNRLP